MANALLLRKFSHYYLHYTPISFSRRDAVDASSARRACHSRSKLPIAHPFVDDIINQNIPRREKKEAAMASHGQEQVAGSAGTPPPRRVNRNTNSTNSSQFASPSPTSSSGMNAYAVSGGSNGNNNNSHGPVLVASLLQQLQGVLYSYEMVRHAEQW